MLGGGARAPDGSMMRCALSIRTPVDTGGTPTTARRPRSPQSLRDKPGLSRLAHGLGLSGQPGRVAA